MYKIEANISLWKLHAEIHAELLNSRKSVGFMMQVVHDKPAQLAVRILCKKETTLVFPVPDWFAFYQAAGLHSIARPAAFCCDTTSTGRVAVQPPK